MSHNLYSDPDDRVRRPSQAAGTGRERYSGSSSKAAPPATAGGYRSSRQSSRDRYSRQDENGAGENNDELDEESDFEERQRGQYRYRKGHRAMDSMGVPLVGAGSSERRRRSRDVVSREPESDRGYNSRDDRGRYTSTNDDNYDDEEERRRRRRESRRRSRQQQPGGESGPPSNDDEYLDRDRRQRRERRHSRTVDSARTGIMREEVNGSGNRTPRLRDRDQLGTARPPTYPPQAYSHQSGSIEDDRRRQRRRSTESGRSERNSVSAGQSSGAPVSPVRRERSRHQEPQQQQRRDSRTYPYADTTHTPYSSRPTSYQQQQARPPPISSPSPPPPPIRYPSAQARARAGDYDPDLDREKDKGRAPPRTTRSEGERREWSAAERIAFAQQKLKEEKKTTGWRGIAGGLAGGLGISSLWGGGDKDGIPDEKAKTKTKAMPPISERERPRGEERRVLPSQDPRKQRERERERERERGISPAKYGRTSGPSSARNSDSAPSWDAGTLDDHAFAYRRGAGGAGDGVGGAGARGWKMFGALFGLGGADDNDNRDRDRDRGVDTAQQQQRGQQRMVSGNVLERGHSKRDDKPSFWVRLTGGGGGSGGGGGEKGRTTGSGGNRRPGHTTGNDKKMGKRKKIYIGIAIAIALFLIILIPIVVSKNKKNSDSSSSSSSTTSTNAVADTPNTNALSSISSSSIPASAKGTITDPFTWLDTTYFNVTYTSETVAGMPLIGLNSTWDDTVQANPNVPALDKPFKYGSMPIRGVNIGGFLSLEPFITPSFFSQFNTRDGVVDEWTLSEKLGSTRASTIIETHYSSWIRMDDLVQIREAGFDHVRIPFSYWLVKTYTGDPYVSQIGWRYLLRSIEWCRMNGLRVKLDLHGLPGSQNGWNHSGKQGYPGWLNGTDGDENGTRSLSDIHNTLSIFFSQARYKNVVTIYGLVNEPRMVVLDTAKVLDWTDQAILLVRKNGFTGVIAFGDGFMGLDNWQGKLQDQAYGTLLLDVHQYVIFNSDQIALPHDQKLTFACAGWTAQAKRSMDKTTGFGPTMCGEWSQADTDCAQYLNNVGVGARWDGTLNFDGRTNNGIATSELTPMCPTRSGNPNNLAVSRCACDLANADPSTYSAAYKAWLKYFAEAQMYSFEQGWGWFYWTWKTESAPQWSWQWGLKEGMVPAKVWDREYSCGSNGTGDLFDGLSEAY